MRACVRAYVRVCVCMCVYVSVCVCVCVTEIRKWMKTNSLKLNDSKTEVIVFDRSAQQVK